MSYTKRAFMAMKYPETHGPQPGDEEEGAGDGLQAASRGGGASRIVCTPDDAARRTELAEAEISDPSGPEIHVLQANLSTHEQYATNEVSCPQDRVAEFCALTDTDEEIAA